MLSKCFLETEGYLITFELSSMEKSTRFVDTIIEFRLVSSLSEISIRSKPTFIETTDLNRLITYFKEHILTLEQNPDTKSHTFVPMELGFQVQALSGEIRSSNDGEFSIRFMINVGRANENASATYIGGESQVTLKNISIFISSLERVRNNLNQSL